MGDHDELSCLYKVLVVGEAGAGKTCIIRRYVHNIFQVSTKSTIGVDFALKMLPWEGGRQITLQIWDIAGQERYGQMTRVYYQAAVGALVVFDITKPDSFDAVQKWKQDIDNKVFLQDGRPIPCVLLANKCDLQPLATFKSKEAMDAYTQQLSFAGWFETSAMKDIGIKQAFEKLVERMVDDNAAAHPYRDDKRDGVDIRGIDKRKKDGSKKCSC
eukprot:TRINITY_DN9432_c0_g1_i1.p1 TRINITY_DN9432_c0_g1~~TRINITY_DN9432_c0_g1_i1.p1  ORF type:complete len:244 (+),score=102.23 TRINITY_DN9432_c0_g1_i1:88-732(+)